MRISAWWMRHPAYQWLWLSTATLWRRSWLVTWRKISSGCVCSVKLSSVVALRQVRRRRYVSFRWWKMNYSPVPGFDQVVEAVRGLTDSVTLAIGDGANDVAMIQKAHVGVGISGMEGLQAVGASDYSIGQFRFLRRLLLVHGAFSYYRVSRLILFSFYKNIVFLAMELWFAIYSCWSGQILFERWTIAFYNVLFTAVPPLALGLFDQSHNAQVSYDCPQLYKTSRSDQRFNLKIFCIWVLNGRHPLIVNYLNRIWVVVTEMLFLIHAAVVHSMTIFWFLLYVFHNDVVWSDGRSSGYLVLGNTVYTCVVVTVSLKALLEATSWTWFLVAATCGSVVTWFIFVIVYRFPDKFQFIIQRLNSLKNSTWHLICMTNRIIFCRFHDDFTSVLAK